MYQRTALGNIHAPKLHSRNSDLHATLSADSDCVLSRRTNGLHHTDAYFKLRRGSDVADVERVEQYGDYVYHSRCAVVHRPVGCDRRKWRVGDRQPHFVRCVWQPVRERAAHLYQRTALGNIHVPNLHTRNGAVHAAVSADTDTLVSRRPNRHVDADAHLKLRCRRNISNVGRVGGHGEYLCYRCDGRTEARRSLRRHRTFSGPAGHESVCVCGDSGVHVAVAGVQVWYVYVPESCPLVQMRCSLTHWLPYATDEERLAVTDAALGAGAHHGAVADCATG